MPLYDYACTGCEWCGDRFASIDTRDEQFCATCGEPLAREEIARIQTGWTDKAYVPAIRMPDGSAKPTVQGEFRRGLRWH